MFCLILKKKVLGLSLVCLLLLVGIFAGVLAVKGVYSPKPTYTIVVDAGHGGFDVK